MAEKISWNVTVTVAGGPKLQLARALEVDAYDKLTVSVPGNAANSNKKVTVDVQPSGEQKVTLLCVVSSLYGDKLTYNVDGGAEQVALDQPQILAGVGQVGLLGAPPRTLDFFNRLGAGKTAEITILVGRSAAEDG